MTLFPITSILSVSIILLMLTGRLFVLVRPKLTAITAVLFASFICLGGVCYFGALSNYAESSLPTRAGLLLRDISYNGMLISGGMAFFLGALGLIFFVARAAIRRITSR